MERIEEFKHEGKQVIYFNLSDIKTNAELGEIISAAKETISRYAHNSVYTVTNISKIAFDTNTKEIAADWMDYNSPYVINAAFFGVSGARKIMMNAVFALSGRKNINIFHDMKQSLEWIGTL